MSKQEKTEMMIDTFRDVAGAEDAEKITIRLEVRTMLRLLILTDSVKADGKSICVESMETGQGKSIR